MVPPTPGREFRCDVCGRVDVYNLPRFTFVKPIHCGQPMRPGGIRTAKERADVRMDLIEDKRQPWRLDPGAAQRRAGILAEHPTWDDLYQVWRTAQGRLWGSEFVGMIGRVGAEWHWDLGVGIPDAKRTGKSDSKEAAVGAMIQALA